MISEIIIATLPVQISEEHLFREYPSLISVETETREIKSNEASSVFNPQDDHTQSTVNSELSLEPSRREDFVILPLGFYFNDRNVLPSTMVKGLEDGQRAIDFQHWLLPFNDLVKTLQLTVITKDNDQLELRSSSYRFSVTFDSHILVNDPDLGQAISVSHVINVLNIPTIFNLEEYAIVFQPSWVKKKFANQRYLPEPVPVELDGLPQFDPPFFTVTGVVQNANLNDSGVSSFNNDNFSWENNFEAIGSLAGGSLFAEFKQYDRNKGNEWRWEELQYFRPDTYHDLMIGTQAPFWQAQNRNARNYVGMTFIQRFGYTAPNNPYTSSNGVDSRDRLASSEIKRTISGKADPGTLVQLVTKNSNLIVAEQLVDEAGEYVFPDVIISSSSLSGFNNSQNYQLLLYADGDLSEQPETIPLNYRHLKGQISRGNSALIITGGSERTYTNDSLIGDLNKFQGGLGYYLGLSNQVSLGAGIVYDDSTNGYTEIFYQPDNVPLSVRLGALIGDEVIFNTDLNYNSKHLSLSLGADENSQRINGTWRLSKKFSLLSRWSSNVDQDDLFEYGFNANFGSSTYLTITHNTDNQVNGYLRSNFDPVFFNFRKNNDRTNSEFIYNLSGGNFYVDKGHGLRLTYETDENDNLGSLNWFYRSPLRGKDGRSLLDFELGYGLGSQGNGIIASASTTLLPGLGLRLTYRQIGLDSDNSQLNIGLFTSFLLQPNLNISNNEQRLNKLRTQGGVFLQAFLDQNNNGKRDQGEDYYTKDAELMYLINNQGLDRMGRSGPEILSRGVALEIPPGKYRLDIDPAGLPVGWKATQSAYAVKVGAGSYTKVTIPLIPSFVLTGRVFNNEGEPLGGVRVEAISVTNPEQKFTSITNGAGIYYLENLAQGQYNFFVDGQPSEPSTFDLKDQKESFLEVNLRLNSD